MRRAYNMNKSIAMTMQANLTATYEIVQYNIKRLKLMSVQQTFPIFHNEIPVLIYCQTTHMAKLNHQTF